MTFISLAYGDIPPADLRNQGISVKGESQRSIISGISSRRRSGDPSLSPPKTTRMIESNEIASISSCSESRVPGSQVAIRRSAISRTWSSNALAWATPKAGSRMRRCWRCSSPSSRRIECEPTTGRKRPLVSPAR
jgi:hypothetical protein